MTSTSSTGGSCASSDTRCSTAACEPVDVVPAEPTAVAPDVRCAVAWTPVGTASSVPADAASAAGAAASLAGSSLAGWLPAGSLVGGSLAAGSLADGSLPDGSARICRREATSSTAATAQAATQAQ